jgi:hypothetical protein
MASRDETTDASPEHEEEPSDDEEGEDEEGEDEEGEDEEGEDEDEEREGAPWFRTEAGWQVMLGVVPLVPWALFHLAEQWSALGGRAMWLGRMRANAGVGGSLLEVLVVLSVGAWLVLLARGRERPSVSATVAQESGLGRALLALERPAAWITAVLVLVHAATLWLPRITGQASLLEGYEILREATGRLPGLVLVCVGIPAFVLHVAASIPSCALILGFGGSRDARQGARVVGVGLAACLFLLFTQLAGWHATGGGVIWPIRVVEVADDTAPLD